MTQLGLWRSPFLVAVPAVGPETVSQRRPPLRRGPGYQSLFCGSIAVLATRRWHSLLRRRGAESDQDALVRQLQRTVARLEEANRRLRAEVEETRRCQERETQSSKAAAAAQPASDGAGHFNFPKADLPLPFESIRVVAPGHGRGAREAEGDWLSLFRNAAPYIASFRGGVVVVHVPSELLEDGMQGIFKGVMEDVAFCSLLGLKMVLVTSVETRVWRRLNPDGDLEEACEQASSPSFAGTKVGNRLPFTVIDEQAVRVAKQEAGFARVEVESALSAGFEKRSPSSNGESTSAGLFPVRSAVSVISSTNFFTASPMGVRDGVDLQYAGVVRSVNVDLLQRQLQDGGIVSITPIGSSPSGEVFFVSSEQLAASIASKLQAIKLVYITRGQCMKDTRSGAIIAGVQAHNASELLKHLESEGNTGYSEEERASEWFCEFVRLLRLLVGAVSPKGVRRGHLVEPFPGSILQEFYTTDGSGTCIAQDLYQGLGLASLADATSILDLLSEDPCSMEPDRATVEASCVAGDFFVWRRDEVVLGCGQLVAHTVHGEKKELVAELRHLAVLPEAFDTDAPALFAYAERAAVLGGAAVLAVPCSQDSERNAWFVARGLREPSASEQALLPQPLRGDRGVMVMRLGKEAEEEAVDAITAYADQQRMWGGIS
eukprot:TRINITY_DN77838_c0_g1_i1.p1 TRINITY_DN77838_c0_g1~~TRINITY_DN77838_c0_g1_i1.p1  ORF type:complete len:660 (+),score=167.92 TRINITY_DN77838_c0_g1_i1:58-2037(+)